MVEILQGHSLKAEGLILTGRAARKAQAPASGGRVEAETAAIITGFSVKATGAASNGFWLQGGAAGVESIAQITHGLGAGTFDITVAHFDESDGQSVSSIYKNGVLLDSWTWNVDADQGTGNASPASQVNRTIPGVALVDGDVIEIRGTPHASESLRIDYLDFALV